MAETATDRAFAPIPTRKKRGLAGLAWRLSAPVRRLLGVDGDDNSVEASLAVSYFLSEMLAASGRTYATWSKLLNDALSECNLGFDERRSLFDANPVDDFYFAGVVALECARMRGLYPPFEAAEILGEVGDQVDAAAGRHDRVVSDLVFLVLGRIELGAGVDRMKTPYDQVVKAILQHMGVHKIDNTKVLMSDKALRHLLGEPLALGVPQWWKAFQPRFSLYWPEPEEQPMPDDDADVPAPVAETPGAPMRGRRRRRATAF